MRENERAGADSKWKGPFFTIWAGQACSLVGSMLVQFALVWWLTKSTGSATVLATGTLLAMLPGVLLGPVAGACVDRWNRRLVMMVADGATALAVVVLGLLFWAGLVQTWHIYVIMVLRSIGGTFHWPAMQSSTSLMVPKEQLSRIAGMNQTLQGVMNIITPPLGALAMSVLPLYGVLAIDVVTACLAIIPLCFVHIPQPERTPSADGQQTPVAGRTTLWQDMGEGLRYMWHWPGLMAVCVMAMMINFLLVPAFSLMPLLVSKYFHGEALQLGWMDSAYGFGAVAGGLLLSAWGGFRRKVTTSMMGLALIGVGVLVIGLTPASLFGMALAGMAIAGVANPITNGPLFAVLQSTVDPDKQGRVLTLLNSACSAIAPLGMAIAGPLGDSIGVRFWYIIGGILCLVMSAAGLLVPAVIDLEGSARPGMALTTSVEGARVPAVAK